MGILGCEDGKLLKDNSIYNIKGIKGMVCNLFKILDENDEKQLPIVEYKMKYKPTYVDYCRKVMNSMNETVSKTVIDDELNETKEIVRNDAYIEPTGLMLKFQNKYMEKYESFFTDDSYWRLKPEYWEMGWDHEIEQTFRKHFSLQDIMDYLGIIPFVPSVMINISPDWKEMKNHKNKVNVLKEIIDNYMKEQWYEKWEYVIENGSDGKHIHAHIVAQMNTKRLKSVESHLKKGNHSQQLKKYAKKIKGMEGIIKGSSVQKIFLRTEEIVKDKLLYLHEETKPDGHKNHHVIEGGYVVGCL